MNRPAIEWGAAADVRYALAEFTAFWDEDDSGDEDALRDNADQCLTAARELARTVEEYRDALHALPDH